MKAAPFEYHRPRTIEAAVEILAEHGDETKVLAGGQSLVPVMALRLGRPAHLVDVNRIDELAEITRSNGSVRVGSMVRHRELERDERVVNTAPLLARAAVHIGHFQIRNRGTVGGSLAHADPAAELPAVALALDAEMEVTSTRGTKRIPAAEFFTSTFVTALEPEELLTGVHLPLWRDDAGFAVAEVARRSGDFALAGAVCGVLLDGGRITRVAIGLIGMGSAPIRAHAVERAITGSDVGDVDVPALARDALAELAPPSDTHCSGAYRRKVGAHMIATAFDGALAETGGVA